MKTKLVSAFILFMFILTGNQVHALEQTQKVNPLAEISLRNDKAVHFDQREKRNLEIFANSSTPDEIRLEEKISRNDNTPNKREVRKAEKAKRQREIVARKRQKEVEARKAENERRQKESELRKSDREKLQRKERKNKVD
jgi:hypothetical protein